MIKKIFARLWPLMVLLGIAVGVWSQLGTAVSGTVPYRATATDGGTGVASCDFLVDGVSVGTDTADGDDNFEVQWDTTQHPDGSASLRVDCVDGLTAGGPSFTPNVGMSAVRTVIVDNNVPVVTVSEP